MHARREATAKQAFLATAPVNSICVSVSRSKADDMYQSSKEATSQTRLNQHEPSPGISGQVFSSLRATETACPT